MKRIGLLGAATLLVSAATFLVVDRVQGRQFTADSLKAITIVYVEKGADAAGRLLDTGRTVVAAYGADGSEALVWPTHKMVKDLIAARETWIFPQASKTISTYPLSASQVAGVRGPA